MRSLAKFSKVLTKKKKRQWREKENRKAKKNLRNKLNV